MINDNDRLDLHRVIAMVEAENVAEGVTWPTYADRVEMGYKAFEIGLWELSRDNHAVARRWLRNAVDYGVEDARSLLAICVETVASTPTAPTTMDTPTRPMRTVRTSGYSASTALGAFAVNFAARPAHERRAAFNWFPRRQLAIVRSVAQVTIHARDLVRALDRARDLDRARIVARDVDRDPVLARVRTDELAVALTHAHGQALELRHVLDRDHASELAQTRDLARGLARDLARVHARVLDRVLDRVVDRDLTHVLGLVRDGVIVHDLARVRDGAFVQARDIAIGRAIDPARFREVALAHVRSGDRDLGFDQALIQEVDRDVASALALDLASALDRDRDRDQDTDAFDREVIEAVERLEKALSPATQPSGRP